MDVHTPPVIAAVEAKRGTAPADRTVHDILNRPSAWVRVRTAAAEIPRVKGARKIPVLDKPVGARPAVGPARTLDKRYAALGRAFSSSTRMQRGCARRWPARLRPGCKLARLQVVVETAPIRS